MDEPGANASPLSLPPVKRGSNRRLSIADLLLITLGTAVALWIMQVSGPTKLQHIIPTVLFAPLYGAAIAAVLLAAIRTQRPYDPFVTQPGHWLLQLTGSMFLGVGLLFRGGAALTRAGPAGGVAAVLVVAGIVLLVFSAGLFLFLLIAYDDLLHWRRVFRLFGATLIVPVVGGCCLVPIDSDPPWLVFILALCITFGPPLLLFIATIAAIVEDFRRRAPRDFWHWLGLAAFFGAPAHFVTTVLIEGFAP